MGKNAVHAEFFFLEFWRPVSPPPGVCSGHLTVTRHLRQWRSCWRLESRAGQGRCSCCSLCVMFTPGAGHTGLVSAQSPDHTGDYTTPVTDTGTRGHTGWCKRAQSPQQGSRAECLWRRHPVSVTVIQQPPQAGDQLSLPGPRLPAQWPVGAGVCYELTSAEHWAVSGDCARPSRPWCQSEHCPVSVRVARPRPRVLTTHHSWPRVAGSRLVSRRAASYSRCVFRHRYRGRIAVDRALVYTDCSQAQPSGANQLSFFGQESGAVIGLFQIFLQWRRASQPKRTRPEQASSALVTESVKQDGV